MAQNIIEEQKQQLQQTILENGMNAWDYVLAEREEDRPWAIAGILSCMKKGYNLNSLMICWEARELRYANAADCAQLPILTEEQKQQLMVTTMDCGRNAWAYTLTWPTDDQPWIAAGILSCMKKGYSLNRLTVNWEARELRYANAADCAQSSENQIPILTEEQQQLLQQTALTDGTNAWAWVLSQREVDRPWAVAGILFCIDKGYDLNEAMICWEARELRYRE